MDDLVRWLTACLAEDERIARAADPGPWKSESLGRHDQAAIKLAAPTSLIQFDGSRAAANGMHVSRHDPARVLREVEMKRQLLALHVITVEKANVPPFDSYTGERNPDEYNVTCAVCGWASDDRSSACLTLRLLTLPYAGREGYRAEWAPTE